MKVEGKMGDFNESPEGEVGPRLVEVKGSRTPGRAGSLAESSVVININLAHPASISRYSAKKRIKCRKGGPPSAGALQVLLRSAFLFLPRHPLL